VTSCPCAGSAAVPTVVTGAAEWAATDGGDRRASVLHAALDVIALAATARPCSPATATASAWYSPWPAGSPRAPGATWAGTSRSP
jgi:hypothetical protein